MTLANKLTCARIVMVPIIWFFAILDDPWMDVIAVVFFVLAGLTDALDGYLARKMQTVTSMGKILDPVADKLVFFAAVLPLALRGEVPGWMVMIFLSREIAISALRTVVVAQGGQVMAAKIWGKLKTIAQDAGIIALLMASLWPWIDRVYLGDILMWLALALAVISMVDYFVSAREHISWGVEK